MFARHHTLICRRSFPQRQYSLIYDLPGIKSEKGMTKLACCVGIDYQRELKKGTRLYIYFLIHLLETTVESAPWRGWHRTTDSL